MLSLVFSILILLNSTFAKSEINKSFDLESCPEELLKFDSFDQEALVKTASDKESLREVFNWKSEEQANYDAFSALSVSSRNLYIIRKVNLKALNEQLLSIAETDLYIFNSYKTLKKISSLAHTLVSSEPKARVIYSDYKNTFLWSNLSKKEFTSQILEPFIEETAKYLNQLRPEKLLQSSVSPHWTWKQWLIDSLIVGSGRSIEEAHFSAVLDQLNVGIKSAEFEKNILRLRHDIVGQLGGIVKRTLMPAEVRLKMDELLAKMQTLLKKGKNREYLDWLDSKGIIHLYATTEKYLEYLQIVDLFYAPARIENKFWLEDRSRYYLSSDKAKYVVAFDIQGLGVSARQAQDRWVEAGAKVNEVARIYQPLTRSLESNIEQIKKWISVHGGEVVESYTSGDDGLILLKNIRTPKRLHSLFKHLREGKSPKGEPLPFHLYLSDPIEVEIKGENTEVYEAFSEAQSQAQKMVLVLKEQSR